MDDLLIQEEITVKTEPSGLELLKEQQLMSSPHQKDDLLFMKFGPETNGIQAKLELSSDKDTDYLFLDPDGPIGHYEEVLEGQADVENGSLSFISSGNKSKSPKSYDQPDIFSLPNKNFFGDTSMEEEEPKYQTTFMLECSFCRFTTAIERVMKNHMLHHIDRLDLDALVEESKAEDSSYQCLFCPFTSVSAEMFKYHLKFKHMPPKDSIPANPILEPEEIFESDDEDRLLIPLDCKYCNFHCKAVEEMNDHLPKYHPEKILKCSACSFCTFNKSAYKVHLETHGKTYSCSKCNYSTIQKDEYTQHKATHIESKIFTCTECGYTAKTKKSFYKHKDKHFRKARNFVKQPEEGMLACDECPFVARTIQGFNKHKAKHFRRSRNVPDVTVIKTEEDLYPCAICDFEARTLQGFNKHAEKHERLSGNFPKQFITTAEEIYQCDLCNFSARTLQGFNKHRGKHMRQSLYATKKNETEHYPCLECSFVAKTLQGYNKHRAKHERIISKPSFNTYIKTEHATFLCDECEFEAKTLQGFNKHKEKHYRKSIENQSVIFSSTENVALFECDECSFSTKARQALLKHQARHLRTTKGNADELPQLDGDLELSPSKPKNPELYSCNDCSFESPTFGTFLKHKRKQCCSPKVKKVAKRKKREPNRTGKNYPFHCSHCSYKAIKKSHLSRHEMIHTGEKPFACPHCSYCCNQASTLKVHIRRHTGESPFACSLCPFKTFASNSLTAHLKKHESGSPLECEYCHQLYQNDTALKHHLKVHQTEESFTIKGKRRRGRSTSASPKKMAEFSVPPAGLYQCSQCNFQCSKFVELSQHTLQHKMGEEDKSTKYGCQECDLNFARKKEIKAHFKSVHPGQAYKSR